MTANARGNNVEDEEHIYPMTEGDFGDEDDDVICEEEETYSDTTIATFKMSSVPSAPTRNHEDVNFVAPASSLSVTENTEATWKYVSPTAESASSKIFEKCIFPEIFSHPKLEAVKRICDAETVADKNSIASKVLHSLLYDFAKSAAAKCPFRNAEDARCKRFYAECFEEMWNQFLPNLRELDERDAVERRAGGTLTNAAGRERSIRTSCRDLFRRNFFTLVLRQNKKESTRNGRVI